MNPLRLHLLLTTFMAIANFTPAVILAATERVVVPTISQCPSGSICYTTIQAAITAADAAALDFITVHPGTYTETVTLDKNVPIAGTETARVFISGNGSGPVIKVSGVTNVAPTIGIRKLTFTNATTGISVIGSSGINITNNIFRIGTTGTAISVDNASTVNIINNTFYLNLTAISFLAGAIMDIENNIFYGNGTGTTAISNFASAAILQYNCFFNITADQTGTVGNVTTDPLFVSASAGDFHLRTLSPCINAGNGACTLCGSDSIDSTTADMGAYGGPRSDTIPFPVSGLTASDVSILPPPYTAQLTWTANSCYQVTGYKIYYGTTSGTYTTTIDAHNVTTSPVAGLTAASAPVGAPVLTNGIANQTLLLAWNTNPVSGATGYEVRYNDTVTPPVAPVVDAGNTTAYALSGLTNGTSYYVSVTPYRQEVYYFTVVAYYVSTDSAFEGAKVNETSLSIGGKTYGTSSNIIHDYPELITPSPNLPNNGGCFIATAVYGHYSAPQVRALREFRNRYLLTNAPGKAFVRWYYAYGPIAANFLNAHPWLKPAVRVALMPAVGAASVLTETSPVARAVIFALFAFCIFCVTLKLFAPRANRNRCRNRE